MKKTLILLAILLSTGIMNSCTDEEVTPIEEQREQGVNENGSVW